MKTLFLIRHAKSSWDAPALLDKGRPLNARGQRAARKMGKRLAERDVSPDLIVSSSAMRAPTTAGIIAKNLDYKLKEIVLSMTDCMAATRTNCSTSSTSSAILAESLAKQLLLEQAKEAKA